MIFINIKTKYQKAVLVSLFFSFCHTVFAQKADSTKATTHVNAAITITNNGISVIPTFILGKPATIFDLTVRKKRLSFEPQLRFAIEDAKPWSFIFWMRYKLIKKPKFQMGIGAHPSTVFGTTIASVNGTTKELMTVKRFFAGELSPTYFVSKNINFGVYYLYSRGIGEATRNTNFVALGGNFSNIRLFNDFYLKLSPQVYFLKMDTKQGYYATSTITVTKQHLPLSISAILNQKIQSTIPSKNFVWNLSLIYAF